MAFILAIDASTKSTGIALFNDTELVMFNCLTASSSDVIKRIQKIIEQLKPFLLQYKIDTIILEEVRPITDTTHKQNIQTHRVLMWLQAAINFLTHEISPKTKIEYVYPSEWRAKCGIKNGRGVTREKEKMYDIAFVKEQYSIDVNDDIADAIGIGHAFVHHLDNEINWG